VIARLWEHLLAIERVGIHDDFFELGGHSLLATQLIQAARRSPREFPLREVFRPELLQRWPSGSRSSNWARERRRTIVRRSIARKSSYESR
jgi:hypothetical protein